jgi:hypothetical protein
VSPSVSPSISPSVSLLPSKGILLRPHPGSRIYALIGQCMQGFWPGWAFEEGQV